MMGNYQTADIARYLLAKYEAAQEILQEIINKENPSEDDLVNVQAKKQQDSNQMHMEAEQS